MTQQAEQDNLYHSPVEIPPNTLVLVTNATQIVPLAIIHQLLARGCRVRAATPWMAQSS
jgi:nucleoside-diphosphate-sugar epimerase